MNTLAILRDTVGKSTTILDYFGLRQSSYELTITDFERALKLMKTLAILRGTFGNF